MKERFLRFRGFFGKALISVCFVASIIISSVNDYKIYDKLKRIRDLYAKAAKRERNEKNKMQYEYFVMAIDRALK